MNYKFIDNTITFTNNQLLQLYQDQKNLILKNIDTDKILNLWKDYLSHDQHCYNNNCYICDKMKHLVKEIKYDEPVDNNLIITKNNIDQLSIKLNNNILCVDLFTGKVLMTWIVEQLLTDKQLPNFLNLHIAYICNTTGYTLYTAPLIKEELGTIDKIEHFSYDLLIQLFVIFDVLKEANFILGKPNKNILLINSNPCSYKYKNKKIISPYTLMLANLTNSSITYKNTTVKTCSLFKNKYNCHNYYNYNNYYIIKYLDLDNKECYPTSFFFYLLILDLQPLIKEKEAVDLVNKIWIDKQDITSQLLFDPTSTLFN